MTIWRMRIPFWEPKATNTHSEYVIFTVFPLQIWLHQRASMLRYTCIAYLVDLQQVRLLKVCEEVELWLHSFLIMHKFSNLLSYHYWRDG